MEKYYVKHPLRRMSCSHENTCIITPALKNNNALKKRMIRKNEIKHNW